MTKRLLLHNLHFLFLLWLCTGVFFLHIKTIELEDYWADEIFTYEVAKLPSASAIWERLKTDTLGPLYFWYLHYFLKFAEARNLNFRWLSVFWAIVGITGCFFWLLWSFGKPSAILTALFLAFSPFWFTYAQEVRMYTMYPALLWWGAAVLILALRTNRFIWWLLSSVLNALAIWTHFHAVFFVIAELFALLIIAQKLQLKSPFKILSRVSCGIVFLSIPLLGLIINQILNSMGNIKWLSSPKWYALYTCFTEDYLSFVPQRFPPQVQPLLTYIIPLLLVGVFLLPNIIRSWKKRFIKINESVSPVIPSLRILLILTAILPVTLMFLLSFSPIKFFSLKRYTILGLAPFLGLLSVMLFQLRFALIRYALILLIIGTETTAISILITTREKPDWKRLTEIIDRNVAREDILIVTPPYWGNAYFYYSRHDHQFTEFGEFIQSQHQPARLFHLIYNLTQTDPQNPFFPWIAVQFMNHNTKHSVLFTDQWYTLIKYEDINYEQLRKWYLKGRLWQREMILQLNPVVFKPVEELAQQKNFAHFAPLQLDERQEVFCWLHNPPVPITITGNFLPGEYIIILKVRIGEFPPPLPYNLLLYVDEQLVEKWSCAKPDFYYLQASYFNPVTKNKINITLDGDWHRPSEINSASQDNRRLMLHFYWLAILKKEN